jgi:polyhydroxybutyrate depolymerase
MAWAAGRWVRPLLVSLALASILASWLFTRDRAVDGAFAQTAAFSYPALSQAAACSPGTSAGSASPLRTAGGVALTVRTPSNYDSRYAHALLVVFAPAGADRAATERFTGLTGVATRAGFIVVYADHRTLSLATVRDLGTIPTLLAQSWCIDPRRVFLTGHSDGGTVATALAVSVEPNGRYAGIAPSAAGFTAADLAAYRCPAPLAVYVAHGSADELFPGFGRQAAAWWASCNKCDVASPERRADDCVEYPGCAAGARTVYCEHAGRHTTWPSRNQMLIEFFAASAASS